MNGHMYDYTSMKGHIVKVTNVVSKFIKPVCINL